LVIRVSTLDQHAERQLEGLEVDKTFLDKASGKDTKRPQLDLLMSFVRSGDTMIAHSMDRFARNLDDLRRIVQTSNGKGVRIEFVKEHLAFTGEDSPMANLLLSVMELLQIRAGFDQGATGEGITRAGQSHLNHKIKFIS